MKRIIPFLLTATFFMVSACGGNDEAISTVAPTSTAVAVATVAPTATTAAVVIEPTTSVQPAAALNVVMNDIYFGETNDNSSNPPIWTVTSGAAVTVTLENRSLGLQHNWAISKLGEAIPAPFVGGDQMAVVLLDSGVLDAGQSNTFTFTAPLPGEYTVICTVPGHYPVMQGKLVVANGQ